MIGALAVFDYDKLEPDLAADARRIAGRIRSRLTEGYLATGHDLLDMKARLGHGRFGAWLDSEFAMTTRTAERYMSAAKLHLSECDTVSHLPAGTMYALSSPSLPELVRGECLARLRQGERLTRSQVNDKASDFRIRRRMALSEAAKLPRGKRARAIHEAKRKAADDARECEATRLHGELVTIIVDATRDQHALVHNLLAKLQKLGCDFNADLRTEITRAMTAGVAE